MLFFLSVFYFGRRKEWAYLMALHWFDNKLRVNSLYELTIKSKCLWPVRGGAVHIHCYGSFSAPSTQRGCRSKSMCDIRASEVSLHERVQTLSVRAPLNLLVINSSISSQLKHSINLSWEPLGNKQPQGQICKEEKSKSDSQQSILCSTCLSSCWTQSAFISLKRFNVQSSFPSICYICYMLKKKGKKISKRAIHIVITCVTCSSYFFKDSQGYWIGKMI